jgi:hypothetical protein
MKLNQRRYKKAPFVEGVAGGQGNFKTVFDSDKILRPTVMITKDWQPERRL